MTDMKEKAVEKYTELLTGVSKKLAEDGMIIEAGWLGFKQMMLPPNCSRHQEMDMRAAFFAGAKHLFDSLPALVDDSPEVSDQEHARLEKINEELNAFYEKFIKAIPTSGSA